MNLYIFIIEILIIIGAFLLNVDSSKYVKQKAERQLKNPYESLPDIIHDNFPPIYFYTPDRFLMILSTISIIYVNSLLEIYKNLLCLGICLFIRSFFIRITIFPSCIPRNRINKKLPLYDQCFLSSHDFMFSGHTIFYFFFGNILNYNIIKIIGPILSVTSRQHYSIDVIIAGIIYSYIFYLL